MKNSETSEFVPDHLKLTKMCKHTVLPIVIIYVPDQYKTQQMCHSTILENSGTLKSVLTPTKINKCATVLSDCNWTRTQNHLFRKRTLSLAKWVSVRLRSKWFWVRVQLQSLNLQISRLL